ncbi:NAD-dependent epimerase/dehydratase family protein [Spirillospora sp. NPDC048911]|uniref:NAD-dependent epimerase/dehydratase family protein n=1 Tax=Spirillospora sp. NPDC048911 TaxID=3364527 RepID=UPI00371D5DFA
MSPLMIPAETTILTGAGGWFGRAYLAALAGSGDPEHARQGAVRVLVPTASEAASVLDVHPKAEIYIGDVADPGILEDLMRSAEGANVVHAAAVIHPAAVADFERVNVGGTRAVLAAAVIAGVRRVVHISAGSAFGVNPRRDETFRHDEPYRPYLGYGQSAMRAELSVKAAHGKGGVETTIVRPPWFYGEWQPVRQATFFTLCRTGRFPVMGKGGMRRSMVYIGNLVQGVIRAELHPDAAGNAYWVADERPYTLREIVETVRQVMRDEGYPLSHRTLRVPEVVGSVAERADRLLQARGRYHQEIHVLGEMNKTIACDVSRTIAELGYRPDVDLAEGMRRSIRWCRSRGMAL